MPTNHRAAAGRHQGARNCVDPHLHVRLSVGLVRRSITCVLFWFAKAEQPICSHDLSTLKRRRSRLSSPGNLWRREMCGRDLNYRHWLTFKRAQTNGWWLGTIHIVHNSHFKAVWRDSRVERLLLKFAKSGVTCCLNREGNWCPTIKHKSYMNMKYAS